MNLALLVVALLSTPPTSPQALYRAGSDAYRAGRYDVAITAFEAALEGADRPDLLFSLGQAHRLQYFASGGSRHLEAAIDAYRGYLERVPDGKRRAHATQHLSTLVPYLDRLRIEQAEGGATKEDAAARIIVTSAVPDARARLGEGESQPLPAAFEVTPGNHRIEVTADLYEPAVREVAGVAGTTLAVTLDPTPLPGRLMVAAPPGARLVLDGEPAGRAPLSAPVELAPGDHELVVLDRGRRPVAQAFAVGRGEALELAVELEPTTQRWLALGALGLSAGMGLASVGTGYFAWDAQAEAEAIEGRVGAGLTAAELGRYHELESQRDELRDVTVGLGIAATGLLATGLALWFLDEPAAPPRRTRTEPQPLPDDFAHEADDREDASPQGQATLASPGVPRSPALPGQGAAD